MFLYNHVLDFSKKISFMLKGFSHRKFFFSENVILLEKLCKKVLYSNNSLGIHTIFLTLTRKRRTDIPSIYSMAKLFFNQKLFHFFCQNVPSSIIRKCILYYGNVYLMVETVDFLPYMVED